MPRLVQRRDGVSLALIERSCSFQHMSEMNKSSTTPGCVSEHRALPEHARGLRRAHATQRAMQPTLLKVKEKGMPRRATAFCGSALTERREVSSTFCQDKVHMVQTDVASVTCTRKFLNSVESTPLQVQK